MGSPSRQIIPRLLFLLGFLISLTSCEIHKRISHHSNNNNHHHQKDVSNSFNDANSEGSPSGKVYTREELTKESYEIDKKFSEMCADFVLNDHVQWPESEVFKSQYAQQLFSFELRDPRDIYDIIVNKKQIDTLYWTQMVAKLQPWAILIIVCLVGQCLCCCQTFCIPELKIFRRCCQIDFNHETESKCEKNTYFFLILLVGGLIFFFSGWVFMNSDIQISSNQLHCTLLWSQKILLEGQLEAKGSQANPVSEPDDEIPLTERQWFAKYGGIEKIKMQMKEMSNFFNHIEDKKSVQVMKEIDVHPFYEEFESVSKMITAFYDKHHEKKLKDPNLDNNQDGTKQIPSEFISSIGPIDMTGTIGWSLKRELSQRKFKIGFVEDARNKTGFLESNSQQIAIAADKAQHEIDILTYAAHSNLKQVDELVYEYSPFLNISSDLIENYFEVVVFIVTCGILGFIFVAWPKYNGCAIFLHCSWYCSTCVLIVGLAVCLVLFSIGLILNNGVCKATNAFLENPEFLKEEGIELDDYLKKGLDYCLFTKPDKHLFEVQNYITEIDLLEKDIAAFFELSLTKQSLNGKIIYAQNVLQIEKYAAAASAYTATTSLNNWSDYSVQPSNQQSKGHCSVSRDQWIWGDSECTYSTTIDSQQSNYDLGFTVCIRLTKSSLNFAAQRYSEKEFDACQEQIGNQIISRFNQIQAFRQSVQDVFGEILKDLKAYNAEVDKLDINIEKVQSKMKQLKDEFQTMLRVVTSRNKGLESTLDCSFIRDSVIRAKNAVCISGLNGILLYTVFFLASSTLLIPFSLIICLSAARILPNREDELAKQMAIQANSQIQQQTTTNMNNAIDQDYNDSHLRRDSRNSLSQSREFLNPYKSQLSKRNPSNNNNFNFSQNQAQNIFSSDQERQQQQLALFQNKQQIQYQQFEKEIRENSNKQLELNVFDNSFLRSNPNSTLKQPQQQLEQQKQQQQNQYILFENNNDKNNLNDDESSYHSAINQF